MHVMFLLALLCCSSLDLVAMDTDNKNITRLPDNFAYTSFRENSVGSMQGYVFDEAFANPVAYLSVLTLQRENCPNKTNTDKLSLLHSFLHSNIQKNAYKNTNEVQDALKKVCYGICNNLLDRFKMKDTYIEPEARHEKFKTYDFTGYIYVFTPQATYKTYLIGFNPLNTEIIRGIDLDAECPESFYTHTKFSKPVITRLDKDFFKLVIKRLENGSENVEEATKIIDGMLGSKKKFTLIMGKNLGQKFPKLANRYFIEIDERT